MAGRTLTRTGLAAALAGTLAACAPTPAPTWRVGYVPEAPCTLPGRDRRCEARDDREATRKEHSNFLFDWIGQYN